jgi:hypothetical protein
VPEPVRWREWLPELLFVVVVFGLAFTGAAHAFLSQ